MVWLNIRGKAQRQENGGDITPCADSRLFGAAQIFASIMSRQKRGAMVRTFNNVVSVVRSIYPIGITISVQFGIDYIPDGGVFRPTYNGRDIYTIRFGVCFPPEIASKILAALYDKFPDIYVEHNAPQATSTGRHVNAIFTK